jgi:hypothetical protein
VLVAALALAIGSSACNTIRQAMPAAKRTAQLKEQMDQLQARSTRFADEYVGRVIEDTAKFTTAIEDPEVRYVIAGWRLSQANAAYANASGPSPVVNALDLVTLATLSRMVIEDTLVPLYPDTAQQLLATHRDLEKTAWTLCDGFLTASQIADLHSILDEWRAQHPKVSSVAFIHFLDFAKQIGRPGPGESERSGGLFAMLGLDPLAGLDPAVREIEQTRALAERTIYYLQRVPYVLNLQLERVTGGLLARPETRDLLRDSAKISESVERFSQVAAALPTQISAEREALIDQLSGELSTQEQTLRPLLGDLRATLDSGSQTAHAIDATVRSLDALMARFPAKSASTGESAPPSRPFDVREYTAAAAEFTRTATELRQLITSVDAQSPALASSVAAAVDRSEALIDYLFLRAAALIVLAVAAVLGAAVLYRKLNPPRPAR